MNQTINNNNDNDPTQNHGREHSANREVRIQLPPAVRRRCEPLFRRAALKRKTVCDENSSRSRKSFQTGSF